MTRPALTIGGMNPIAAAFPGPLALDARAVGALRELAEGENALTNAYTWHQALAGAREGSALQVIETELVGGVAIVRIEGMLAARRSWLTGLLGATVVSEAHAAIADALDSKNVRGVLLAIDSPGGTTAGVPELAALIRDARKPVAVHSSGALTSAAYWIASGARAIAVGSVAMVGSIGVVATHVDVSGAEASRGVKTTEVTAGKYKRIASAYAPLSSEGRATLQHQVDYVYAAFIEEVAAGRGVPPTVVLDRMADGRVFIGKQAQRAGLVDAVSTFEQVLRDLQAS